MFHSLKKPDAQRGAPGLFNPKKPNLYYTTVPESREVTLTPPPILARSFITVLARAKGWATFSETAYMAITANLPGYPNCTPAKHLNFPILRPSVV